MISVHEIVTLDHKGIATILKRINANTDDKKHWPCINKMMDNIYWKYGNNPKMNLNGNIKKCDVVAKSILETAIINIDLQCIIVEIVSTETTQFVGLAFTTNGKITASKIACYEFIDWFHNQDIAIDCPLVTKFSVVAMGGGSICIRCYLM